MAQTDRIRGQARSYTGIAATHAYAASLNP